MAMNYLKIPKMKIYATRKGCAHVALNLRHACFHHARAMAVIRIYGRLHERRAQINAP